MSICVDGIAELYVATGKWLEEHGASRKPALTGPCDVRSVHEAMNYLSVLKSPRRRLLRGYSSFRPGHAAARFLYFLSGSDRIADISPYASSINDFSADGLTLGGTSHGWHVFSRLAGASGHERCLDTLRCEGNSNRAVIPFYRTGDTGGGPKDVACIIAIMPYRREEILHCATHMRAQEIDRLFPLDIFELTMYHEFLARSLGLELGEYAHGSFALHRINRSTQCYSSIEHVTDIEMPQMPRISETTRPDLVIAEQKLREALLLGRTTEYLDDIQRCFEPYWFDILAAAACHAVARRDGREAALKYEDLCEGDHIVFSAELDAIRVTDRS